MGHMTGGAALDADAGVFEDEGSALIGMALQAGLFVIVRCRHQALSQCLSAMMAQKLPSAGLWQSVHWITPSLTRCFTGMLNWARMGAWHP